MSDITYVDIDPAENEMPEDYRVLTAYYDDMRAKWEKRAAVKALRDAADEVLSDGDRDDTWVGVWLNARADEIEARS